MLVRKIMEHGKPILYFCDFWLALGWRWGQMIAEKRIYWDGEVAYRLYRNR